MSRILLLILLGYIPLTGVIADIYLPRLIAYYPLDENAADFSGNGNDGLATNVSFLDGGTGRVAVFSKTSSITIADNSTFDFSSATGLSLTVRVKQESRTNGFILIKMGSGGRSDDEYSLSLTDDGHIKGEFVESSSKYKEILSNTVLALDTWYDIILIWKRNGEITLYVDGELDTLTTSTVTSIQNTNIPLIIGDPGNQTSFVGSAEDINIYNLPLTSQEIDEFTIYDKPTSLNPGLIEDDFILYPNPVKDKLNISIPLEFRNSEYRITDISGRLMFSGYLRTEKECLNVPFLRPGIYTIQIDNGRRIVSKKMMKQ